MVKMILTCLNTENPYSLYGINHLIQKYGVPIKGNSKESKIDAVYGGSGNREDFIIQINGNEMQDETKGQVQVKTEKFKKIGYILSGQGEVVNKMEEDKKREIVRIPIIDYFEEALFNSILYAARKLDMPVVQKAFWPGGKNFAVCLTHDVDELRKTYQYGARSLRHIKTRNIGGLKKEFLSLLHKMKGKEPYWTFDDIMDLERKLDVKSTFYFLNETGKVKLFDRSTWRHYGRKYDITDKKVAELIKTLHSGGWEIGLHGSFYSYNHVDKLKKEKEILEDVLGAKVQGIRQHNLNLDIPNTWKHQEEIGLEYDTTLGFNDCVGFRGGTCFPFHPVDKDSGKPLKLLEIPLMIEDIALFTYDNPWKECKEIINTVEKYNGVLTLLWHHSMFNKIEYPGWAEMYERIIEICKEKDAWITNAGEIARWWRMREESRLECEYDDNTMKIVSNLKNHQHFLNVYLPQDKKVEVLSANAEIISEEGNSIKIYVKENSGEIILEIR